MFTYERVLGDVYQRQDVRRAARYVDLQVQRHRLSAGVPRPPSLTQHTGGMLKAGKAGELVTTR